MALSSAFDNAPHTHVDGEFLRLRSHVDVDTNSGLVHIVRGTSGNMYDVIEGISLLHEK